MVEYYDDYIEDEVEELDIEEFDIDKIYAQLQDLEVEEGI